MATKKKVSKKSPTSRKKVTKKKSSSKNSTTKKKTYKKKATARQQADSKPEKDMVKKIGSDAQNERLTSIKDTVGAEKFAEIEYETLEDELQQKEALLKADEALLLEQLEKKAKVSQHDLNDLSKEPEHVKKYFGDLAYYWKVRGLTIRKICEKYPGLKDGFVYKYCMETQKSLEEYTRDNLEDILQLELQKLSGMESSILRYCQDHIAYEHVTRKHGEKLIVRRVKVIRPPNPAYIDKVLKIMERRAKMLGLDQPLEVEVTEKPNIMYGPPKSSSIEEWSSGNVIEQKPNSNNESVSKH